MDKLIEIKETNLKGFYNLAFGDLNTKTGRIDDKAITDNKDTEKILTTVVDAVYAFTDKYSEAWLYATGSTEARTRLYRMGINKYYDKLIEDFDIYGELNNDWFEFDKNINYDGFLIQRKKQILTL